MNEKDSAHSVNINILRHKTYAKESSCNIKNNRKKSGIAKTSRKLSDTTIQTYAVPHNKPISTNVVKRNTSLLSYRLYEKKRDLQIRKQYEIINLYDKYRVLNTDLQNRLYIENPPDDVQAITDVDKKYFRYLNDHHTTQYIPLYKSLKNQYHERLRINQQIGYKRDSVLNIDEHYRKEQEAYERSIQRYADQVKQFEEFIAQDYHRSMETLRKSEILVEKLNEHTAARENLANEQFTIQSRLICLDYLYLVQQKYGRFLYFLSPPSWRAKHREFAHSLEIQAKGFDLGTTSEEDTFNVIFQNMVTECSRGLLKPVLYFSHPCVLMNLFESMEKQHSNHLLHATHVATRAMDLKENVIQLKRSYQQDTYLVSHLIEGFQELVNFCEEREAQLQEKFIKILNGLFYETVAVPDVLRLTLNLEFYYEKLYREESFNMTCLATAKALENMYMDYLFKLDGFTSDSLTLAMKRCLEKEANKIKKANIATRELRSFDMLERALLRAFEESRHVGSTTAVLKRISKYKSKRRAEKSAARAASQSYPPTEAEIEYLRLFTDWTIQEDPLKYLHNVPRNSLLPFK